MYKRKYRDTAQAADGVAAATVLYPRYMSLEALKSAAAAEVAAGAAAVAAAAATAGNGPAAAAPTANGAAAAAGTATNGTDPVQVLPGQKALTKFEIKRLKRAARRQNQPAAEPGAEGAAADAAGNEAGAGNGEAATAGQGQEQEQGQQGQEGAAQEAAGAGLGKTSGKANAEEARKIREALGYVDGAQGGAAVVAAATGEAAAAGAGAEVGGRKAKKAKKGQQQAQVQAQAPGQEAVAEGTAADAGPSTSGAAAPAAATPAAGAKANGKGFKFGFSVSEQVEAETMAKLNHIMMMDSTKDGLVPRRVFVCGMPHEYDEAMIREYWTYCGEIESMDMMSFPDTGNFNGVMFITFKTEAGYEAALACNGEDCEGRTLRVEKCKAAAAKKLTQPSNGNKVAGGTQRVEGYNVAYVGNIAYDATREDLMAMFKPYNCNQVRLHTDKETGKPKGFAHVHFPNADSLDRAMEMDGTDLHGRAIKMSYAQPKRS